MSMDANEILKKVRKIEIKTKGLSQNIFAGEYHSAFKGRGMTFSEVREYQYGDDIRDIDWNVTARHNHPYVKVYEEERELTVMLLVDVSRSRIFGAQGVAKQEMMAEIAATIAFSAIQNNDKIGVIFFSDKIEKFLPPKKGRKHILHIIRELLDFKADNNSTDIGRVLELSLHRRESLLPPAVDSQPPARPDSNTTGRPARGPAARRRADKSGRRRARRREVDKHKLGECEKGV